MSFKSGRKTSAPVPLLLSHNTSSDSNVSQLDVIDEPSDNCKTYSEVD